MKSITLFDQKQNIVSFATILKNCRKYYMNQQKRIKVELSKLPDKGSVHRRNIKGYVYYYFVYRENGNFCADYMGKEKPIRLIEKIEKRRYLKKELKTIETALYGLGVIKRVNHVGLAKRFAIFERDQFTCQYCGRNTKEHKIVLVVDHINPKKRGGEDIFENLITACTDCNSGKRASLIKILY